MKYSELLRNKISENQQVHVWYRKNWCGRFKKGVMPSKDAVIRLVSDHNGFYICEVIASFELEFGFNFEIKDVN